MFSKVAAPFSLPTGSVRGFQFPYILASTCHCLFSHPSGFKWYFIVFFNLFL